MERPKLDYEPGYPEFLPHIFESYEKNKLLRNQIVSRVEHFARSQNQQRVQRLDIDRELKAL